MSISRRGVLGLIGGGPIIAAGAGAGGFALTRTPEKALAPWSAAGGYSDPRKRALSYAILAPNPHNRQPWLVDLSEKDTVVLYRDSRPHAAIKTFKFSIWYLFALFIALLVDHYLPLTF